MPSSVEIKSFAVFDLETTGLPAYNFNKANITELSIHGFAAQDVRGTEDPLKDRRVNHSLTLLFNPRMQISPGSEEITGLDNYMLEHESSFDTNAADLVIGFLKHLRQPVCLVAHNGGRFDFPILKDAFKKLGMELPSSVMCLDSYKALYQLDEQIMKEKAANVDNEEDFKLNTIAFLNDDEPSARAATSDATSPTVPANDKLVENINTDNITIASEKDDTKKDVDWQTINETTPRQGTKKSPKLSRSMKANTRASGVKLNPRCLEFETPPKAAQVPNKCPRPPRGTYKLGNIYSRVCGQQPKVSHQAEADVIMLKDIMFKYGDAFVKYAEENAMPFTSIKPLSG